MPHRTGLKSAIVGEHRQWRHWSSFRNLVHIGLHSELCLAMLPDWSTSFGRGGGGKMDGDSVRARRPVTREAICLYSLYYSLHNISPDGIGEKIDYTYRHCPESVSTHETEAQACYVIWNDFVCKFQRTRCSWFIKTNDHCKRDFISFIYITRTKLT